MLEKRKYFDYELAYKGYKKAKELCNKGGIEELINNKDFEISGGGIDYVGTIEQWSCNGYIPIIASGYNITLYAIDRNFDTDNEENDWYISGEVDIYSYGGGDDNLYINEIKKQVLNPEIIREIGKNLKIVYTPLHGTGNIPVQRILKEIGFKNVLVLFFAFAFVTMLVQSLRRIS